MKISKYNYNEVVKIIRTSIERYIECTNEHHMKYAWLWENEEKYNAILKELGSYKAFEEKYNVDLKEAYKDKQFADLLPIANGILQNIDEIHEVVISTFIEPVAMVYPIKTLEWLRDFKQFCFDEENNFLLVKEQNERLKNYPHFDASKKRFKSLGDYKTD